MAIRPSSRIDRKFRNPCARLAEQVLLGDLAVLERDAVRVAGVPAELVVRRLDGHAGGAGRDDECRDAVVGTRRRRDDRGDLGATVRDERLRPVEHPRVGGLHRPRPGGTGVRPAVGFGESERSQRTPGDEVGQPTVALLVGPEAEDRVGAESDPGRQRDPHRLVDATEFLDRHAQRREVAVTAAPPLGEHDAEEPEVAHLPDDVDGEMMLAVPPGGVRSDLPLGELAHGRPQQLMVGRQLPTHGCTRLW